MTMDLYGHLIDQNLWDAANQIPTAGGISGASEPNATDSNDEQVPDKPAMTRDDT